MSTLKENLTEILAEKQTYLKPGNLKKDVTLLGVTGTLEGVTGEEINITPSTSQQVITPTTGKNAITKATVSAVTSSIDSNITAGNIKTGTSILGVTGTFTGNATATTSDIVSGKTAGVNGSMVTGTYTWTGDSNYSTCLDLTTQILATYVPPAPVDVIGTLTTKLPDPSGLYKFKVEDFIDFIDDIIDYNTEQQSNDDIIAIYMRNSFSYNLGNIWSGDGYDIKYPHLNSLSARTDYYDNIYWTEFKGLLQDLRTKYEPSDVPFIQCAFNYNGQTGGYTYTEFYIQSTGLTGSGTTFDFTW